MKIDLSVIIVSFNTKDILIECLASIWENTHGIKYEIIVVDNASGDGTVEKLKQLAKDKKNLTVIYEKENTGFSKGNNIGLRNAKGKYHLLLNSDTILIENTLKKMVDWMDSHPAVDISSCQLLNPDKTIQPTGGYFPELSRVFLWALLLDDLPIINTLGSYHPHVGQFYFRDHAQDWVTGAFMFMRREVFEKTHGFDENIFMYAEEIELCYRAKSLGFKVYYTIVSKIIHLGNASGSSRNALLGEFKGLTYLYKKHKTLLEQFLLSVLLKLGAVIRLVLFNFLPSKKGVASIYAEAFKIS